MGEKNDTICSYLANPRHFADFINGSVFGGAQVLTAEELEERQFTGKERHEDRNGRAVSRLRSRDVTKLWKTGEQFAVISVENQDELHYLMPFRCMEYDVEDYAKQIRRLIRQHEEAKDLESDAEFLSGIKESDRLNPVVTVVFYHGKGGWTACKELHDMLNFNGENEILKNYTTNYRANIISLQELEAEKFQTGLREVIGIMQRRGDKKELQQYYRENRERFSQLDEDTYDTISVMIDRKEFRERKTKAAMRNEKGKLDMCKALDDIEKDARQEGIRIGIKEGELLGIKAGEEKLAILIGRLVSDGRIEDVKIVAADEKTREALYREYGLEQ